MQRSENPVVVSFLFKNIVVVQRKDTYYNADIDLSKEELIENIKNYNKGTGQHFDERSNPDSKNKT